ncbi:MAG: putative secreted acid phosphatase [Francisella sp.]|jgi:predicted secreted acid phosphatase
MQKEDVIHYYENGDHENEVAQILIEAKNLVDKYTNQPSDNNYAVVFDIDETSLNHYQPLKKANFPQDDNDSIWDKLVLETSAKAIGPTLEFYRYCLLKSVVVFFVSARVADSLEATKLALKDAGYTKFEDVFVFPNEITNYNPKQFTNFKAERRAYIESLGYRILLSVGDQPSDLMGGFTKYGCELPNFLYGKKSFLA